MYKIILFNHKLSVNAYKENEVFKLYTHFIRLFGWENVDVVKE